MSDPMYSVTKDAAGNLTIRVKDGAIIAEDYEDQQYCDFLTWKSHEGPCSGPDFFFDKPYFFFSDPILLAQHCKERGITLFAERPDAYFAVWNSGFLPTGQRELGRQRTAFSGLCSTVASDDDSEDEKTGSITSRASNIYVSLGLWERMNSDLADETSDARRLASCPIIRTFVYFDVSNFTRTHPGHQVLIVNSIQAVVSNKSLWHYGYARDLCGEIEASLCIGDGYIYVFNEPVVGTFFAAYLARLIEELGAAKKLPVAFHFRIGVHLGPVFCFWDHGRNAWNYIGEGINGGNRVLEAIGKDTDDVLFISGMVRRELMARNNNQHPYPQILRCLHNRGRRADKHGRLRRVYELNHYDLISRTEMPPDLKV